MPVASVAMPATAIGASGSPTTKSEPAMVISGAEPRAMG